jgi:hypothetical protein
MNKSALVKTVGVIDCAHGYSVVPGSSGSMRERLQGLTKLSALAVGFVLTSALQGLYRERRWLRYGGHPTFKRPI